MKKILSLVLSGLLLVGVSACTSSTPSGDGISGTFTGTSTGMQGPLTVELVVENDAITAVNVVESTETVSLTSVALERIPAQMVEHQTTKVDTVTGATLTSNAIMRAATAAAEEAGLDMDALNANAYTATAGEAQTWDADVVVVGGGGAGLSAAISAAQEGASVILIEKGSVLGGNTMMAGGAYNAVDEASQEVMILTEAQKNTLDSYLELTTADADLHFAEFPEWSEVLVQLQSDITAYYTANEGKTAGVDMPGFDSISLHMFQIYIGGLRQMSTGEWIASDIDLARTLAENALESYEWAGSIGVGTSSGVELYTVLGAMWPRTHSYDAGVALIDALRVAAENEGVTIYTETAGTSLLVDEAGRVVGVGAEQANGTQITINAANGVILASGGYCANPAMVKEYDEYWGDDLTATTLTTNVGTNDGDGIVMAQAIGANTVGMGVAQLMPSSSAIKGTMTDGIWADASEQIWIDGDGNRFVNEYAERDVLAKASLQLDNGIFYIIYAGSGYQTESGKAEGVNPEASLFGTTVQSMIDNGHVWYGSTLAELAAATEAAGAGGSTETFTEEELREVIEEYNSYVENQEDPEFGKEVLAGAIDIEKIEADPTLGFVISPRRASLHHTMGGVEINTEAQVINTDGEVIEGLYAAGEVAGGVHAGNRLGGNAIADIFVFGRIAGSNAAE
ncbi:MAG: FAD-dependent oxidoreductase [Anaerorhabdus sp.]